MSSQIKQSNRFWTHLELVTRASCFYLLKQKKKKKKKRGMELIVREVWMVTAQLPLNASLLTNFVRTTEGFECLIRGAATHESSSASLVLVSLYSTDKLSSKP